MRIAAAAATDIHAEVMYNAVAAAITAVVATKTCGGNEDIVSCSSKDKFRSHENFKSCNSKDKCGSNKNFGGCSIEKMWQFTSNSEIFGSCSSNVAAIRTAASAAAKTKAVIMRTFS